MDPRLQHPHCSASPLQNQTSLSPLYLEENTKEKLKAEAE